MSEKWYRIILGAAFLVLITIPYLAGFSASSSQEQFGGFLMNPIDGHSYLAKMQQGYNGSWRFKLAYTSEAGNGAFLFLFYLGLGHLGRITQLPLIFVFHAARILSAVWLFNLIEKLMRDLFKENQMVRTGMILALIGSGLGWSAVLAGLFTSDFWVAEAYPFLSAYTNPHFCLGIGIMVFSLLSNNQDRWGRNLIAGILLGIVQPFGVVIIGLVKVIEAIIKIYQEKIRLRDLVKSPWFWSVGLFCLGGGLVLLYQFWAILSDPILVQWHQQNITPKPSIFDLILSFSPCLILAIVGMERAWKSEPGKRLVIWMVIGLGLVFIPWSLQRRFLTGLFFPLSALSVFGLEVLAEKISMKFRIGVIILLFLAVPTNLVILASGFQAVAVRDAKIFLDAGLKDGLTWLEENAEDDALILADAETGLFIPSLTGRRVIYGHPFETIQAGVKEAQVENFFYQEQTVERYGRALDNFKAEYILAGDGQSESLHRWLDDNLLVVYQSGKYRIYEVWK